MDTTNLLERKNKLISQRLNEESSTVAKVKREKKDLRNHETKEKKDGPTKATEKTFKKGPFEEKEKQVLLNALCEHLCTNNLTIEDVLVKTKKDDKNILTKLAKLVPERNVLSVHNYFHKLLKPLIKSSWTQEEVEKLLFFVKNNGEDWKEIGELMGRTSTNCKDKYKELGGKNFEKQIKTFDLITSLKFLKYIQELTGSSILRLKYKFTKSIAQPYEIKDGVLCILTNFKDDKTELIISNFVKLVLDFEELADLARNSSKFEFGSICEKLEGKSIEECKNFWNKLISDFSLIRKAQAESDLKMIN